MNKGPKGSLSDFDLIPGTVFDQGAFECSLGVSSRAIPASDRECEIVVGVRSMVLACVVGENDVKVPRMLSEDITTPYDFRNTDGDRKGVAGSFESQEMIDQQEETHGTFHLI